MIDANLLGVHAQMSFAVLSICFCLTFTFQSILGIGALKDSHFIAERPRVDHECGDGLRLKLQMQASSTN